MASSWRRKISGAFNNAGRNSVDACRAAVRTGFNTVAATGRFSARMTGKAIMGTFDAIETADKKLDELDKRFEDAAAFALREPVGLISKDAKPYADRAGRVGYKAGKIAVNLTGLPAGMKTVGDILGILRPKR